MSGLRDEDSDIERLRSLLLSREANRLSEAEARIRDLRAWVGDAPGLEAATAQILVEALKRADVARRHELAAAIAPAVVAAIRGEIHDSRATMVEALYPLTGGLVAAAVCNPVRDMLEAINRRLDALAPTDRWRLGLRALLTRRSIAQLELAEARAAYGRILLLERGSGKLLAYWRPSTQCEDHAELLGGMIAAINEFASTVHSDQHGELRTLDLGARQLYLNASSRIILASEALGEVSAGRRKRLDDGFLDLVIRHDRGEILGEADLAALARPPARPPSARGRATRWAILCGVAAVGIGFALRGPVHRWVEGARIEAAYRGALAADPRLANYPLTLREDWTEGTVTLKGLAGSAAGMDALLAALTPAAAPMKVVSEVEIVATMAEARAADLAARDEAMSALRDTLARQEADRTAAEERARADRAEIDKVLAGLDQKIDQLASVSTDAERRGDALRGEIAAVADLPAQVAALNAALSTLRETTVQQADAAAARFARQDADRTAAEERARAGRAEIDKVLAGLDQKIDQLAAASTDAERRADALRGEIAAVADLPAKVAALNAALSTLRETTAGQADAAPARLARQEADPAAAEERARAGRAEIDKVLAGLDQKIGELASASTEAERRVDSLRGAIAAVADLPAKVAALESGLSTLREKSDRQADASAARAERQDADRAAAEARATRAEIDKRLAGLDQRIGELVSSATAADRRGEALRGEVAALADLPAKVGALDAAASDFRATIAGQRDALDALGRQGQADRAAGEDRDSALRAELDTLRAGLEDKTREVAAAGEDRDGALRAELDALRAGLEDKTREVAAAGEDRDSALRAELDALRAGLDDKTRGVAAAATDAARRIDALRGEVAALQASLDDPRHVLAEAASRAIILFGERDTFTDPAAADKTLDALADAIRRTGLGVRVIGYADETGTAAGNLDYSKARAAKAAKLLNDRGVAVDKLVQVGRAAQSPIADVSDPRLRNRRVVFEPLYPEEPAP